MFGTVVLRWCMQPLARADACTRLQLRRGVRIVADEIPTLCYGCDIVCLRMPHGHTVHTPFVHSSNDNGSDSNQYSVLLRRLRLRTWFKSFTTFKRCVATKASQRYFFLTLRTVLSLEIKRNKLTSCCCLLPLFFRFDSNPLNCCS